MAFLYLSPSTQEYNPYVNGGNEEYYMNLLADELEPYLHASGISFTRNTPNMTAATPSPPPTQGTTTCTSPSTPTPPPATRRAPPPASTSTTIRSQQRASVPPSSFNSSSRPSTLTRPRWPSYPPLPWERYTRCVPPACWQSWGITTTHRMRIGSGTTCLPSPEVWPGR